MNLDNFIVVGEFCKEFNDLAGSDLPIQTIYRSKGLPAHLIKQRHFNCLKLIDRIPEIISFPDYIGINPNESGNTVELIKVFDKFILIGIKLNLGENYLYVSTMHEVQLSKIKRRLYSGRIKKINNANIDEDTE